tara:strand:+ start:4798 stop:4962 length:165 start_codon:yes stop_codon:yes gene_type:complete
MLYSYCQAFKINPNEAKHTPVKLILEMLQIHAEVEGLKTDEVQKQTREISKYGR